MTFRTAALPLVPGPFRAKLLLPLAASLLAGATLGCGVSTVDGVTPPGAALKGSVHGGQQPIANATVTLWAPGLTGYGSAPTAIVTTTTNSTGSFTFPQPYTCPANSTDVYITASGGDPGSGTNTSVVEAALLGPCSALTPTTFLSVSEVTTVAAAYALAPFASISGMQTSIGTSATNILGLTNAYGAANQLANNATGLARGANDIPEVLLPNAEMNTLANILASCVNSTGNTGPASNCGKLFADVAPSGGSAPVDTFQAAIDIALSPTTNVSALFGLATASAPFQTALSTVPSDLGIGIQFIRQNGYGAAGDGGVDIDATGNAWYVADLSGLRGYVQVVSPSGEYVFGEAGVGYGNLYGPLGLAIDNANQIYVVSRVSQTVTVFDGTTGKLVHSQSVYDSQNDSEFPTGIALDNTHGLDWVTENGGYPNDALLAIGTSSGTNATGSPYTTGDTTEGVALDQLGSVWVANADFDNVSSGTIEKFTPPVGDTGAYTVQSFATGAGTYPYDLAVDASNNVWVAEAYGVAKYSATGVLESPVGGWVANSQNVTSSVAIDGVGHIWVSNEQADSMSNIIGPANLSEFDASGNVLSSAGITANGTLPPIPYAPRALAIDPSGNMWTTGCNNVFNNCPLTEVIGIAAPVLTPLSVATATGKLGQRP